jgi:hypothetical protein
VQVFSLPNLELLLSQNLAEGLTFPWSWDTTMTRLSSLCAVASDGQLSLVCGSEKSPCVVIPTVSQQEMLHNFHSVRKIMSMSLHLIWRTCCQAFVLARMTASYPWYVSAAGCICFLYATWDTMSKHGITLP